MKKSEQDFLTRMVIRYTTRGKVWGWWEEETLPIKQCMYYLDKWSNKHWFDVGVSLRSGSFSSEFLAAYILKLSIIEAAGTPDQRKQLFALIEKTLLLEATKRGHRLKDGIRSYGKPTVTIAAKSGKFDQWVVDANRQLVVLHMAKALPDTIT